MSSGRQSRSIRYGCVCLCHCASAAETAFATSATTRSTRITSIRLIMSSPSMLRPNPKLHGRRAGFLDAHIGASAGEIVVEIGNDRAGVVAGAVLGQEEFIL